MYVSCNDFDVGQGIFVQFTTDNGLTWSPVQGTTSFIRDVQITGDLATGTVYIAGMDEIGGGLTNRANKVYRSTDGGAPGPTPTPAPLSLGPVAALWASLPPCIPVPVTGDTWVG